MKGMKTEKARARGKSGVHEGNENRKSKSLSKKWCSSSE